MKCVRCKTSTTTVFDTRYSSDKLITYRKRQCKTCGYEFYTTEKQQRITPEFLELWEGGSRWKKKKS